MRSWTARSRLAFVAVAGLLCAVPTALVPAAHALAATGTSAAPTRDNPITRENTHPGSTKWQLPWPGYTVADDIGMQIKGYAGDYSAPRGGSIRLHVTTTPAQQFTVTVLRLGYYGGKGGRVMERLGPFHGTTQPRCPTDPTTREIACRWPVAAEIEIPRDWISGVYVAVLNAADHYQSLVPFWVVDHDRRSDVLYLSALNTYEAYNNFPYDPPASDPQGLPRTGYSLYDFNSANSTPAVKVSFDRPFNSQYGGPGDGGLYDFEPELIQFLEKSGYDVSYTNDVDLDTHPGQVLDHRTLVIGGHSEYWTMTARSAVLNARAHRIGLAFISANEIYWQVRYEPSAAGAPRRTMVGYKDQAPDPVSNPALRTIRWRDLGLPEQQIIGVQFPTDGNQDWGGQPWVPINVAANSWVFAGSGVREGHPINAEISGYEIDAFDRTVGKPADATYYSLLSSSPFINFANKRYIQNSSIYKTREGNWVWATGSMDWSWALSPGGSSAGQYNVRRPIQVITVNVLDRLIHDAPAPQ